MARLLLHRLGNVICRREEEETAGDDKIDLPERLDRLVPRVEPLHIVDELRLVHLRLAREDDAGADRFRLHLAARQDLQVRFYRVRVSCNKQNQERGRSLR